MNVNIKELSNDPEEIKKVQEFLFDMIKLEFGYGYVPKWHQDIVNICVTRLYHITKMSWSLFHITLLSEYYTISTCSDGVAAHCYND